MCYYSPFFPGSFLLRFYRFFFICYVQGTVVFQAQVTDNDTGIHGDLRYILVSGNTESKFYLDETLGRLVLLSSLDRETTDQYNVSLRVEDSAAGSPDVRYSNVTVYISVVDVNDNQPECSSNLNSVEISEGEEYCH